MPSICAGRRAAAARSRMTVTSRCSWRMEAGASGITLPQTALRAALGAGNLASAQWLVGAGAYLNYSWEGYTALIDAVHGHDVLRDPHLLDTLQWLIDAGTDLDGVTRYGESGLRVLSRVGRFDAVALLAAAGADTAQLDFSPLHWAVALGDDLERLSACIDQRPETLEARDWWSRTPLLLAAQAGRVPQFEMLRTRGADMHALARCDKPVLHHAVDGDHVAMLSHLLALPVDAEQADQFGNTALMAASEGEAARWPPFTCRTMASTKAAMPSPVRQEMRNAGAENFGVWPGMSLLFSAMISPACGSG